MTWRWCSNHHRLRVDTDMVCLGLNLFDYRKIDRKRFPVAWRARCQARHRYSLWLADLIIFHWPDDISAEISSGAKRNQQGYLWPLSRSHPGGRKSIWVWSARAQETSRNHKPLCQRKDRVTTEKKLFYSLPTDQCYKKKIILYENMWCNCKFSPPLFHIPVRMNVTPYESLCRFGTVGDKDRLLLLIDDFINQYHHMWMISQS